MPFIVKLFRDAYKIFDNSDVLVPVSKVVIK